MEWTEAAVLRSTLVGVTAEVELPGTGLWVRGTVLRTLDANTYVAFAVMNAGPFTPANVERTRYDVPTEITLASVDVALPTRLRLPFGVQPYFIAGIGGKHYAFDRGVLSEARAGTIAPEEGTSFMINAGGGLVVPVSPSLRLDLQVRDTMSEYWGGQQHDVAWTAGLSWKAFRL